MSKRINFQTTPASYRHWRVEYDDDIATLLMDVDEAGGLFDGYELKLNSYDLGVDIELADIVQRMRFEHPQVKTIILRSGKDNVFCAGANIRMLGSATHDHKVNFCKFTNETRNTFEAAGQESGQSYICVVNGTCAGGGYELALACEHIILADDGASSVSLPEVPLLAVLPGTGGLTRLTDKRKIRRDLCDVFCTTEEGVRGTRAVQWQLVDEVVQNSKSAELVEKRARQFADKAIDKGNPVGINLGELNRDISGDGSIAYSTIEVGIDRAEAVGTIHIKGPNDKAPESIKQLHSLGDQAWFLRCARELDDALLHLRFNETEIGVLVITSSGDPQLVRDHEKILLDNSSDWLANEILLYWKRVLKRLDLTSRSLVGLVEPGSCFTGTLCEILFSVDRTYMALGEFEGDNRPVANISLTQANFGNYPMSNDLTRLEARFFGAPESVTQLSEKLGLILEAEEAESLGLVTFSLDDIDWEDEIRLFMEERASFSPDAMSAMEANLRFVGPETMETRIFGRLSSWQNWIFQRPNAVGKEGALQRYGTGIRGKFDKKRV